MSDACPLCGLSECFHQFVTCVTPGRYPITIHSLPVRLFCSRDGVRDGRMEEFTRLVGEHIPNELVYKVSISIDGFTFNTPARLKWGAGGTVKFVNPP